jgi:hypothetical protein
MNAFHRHPPNAGVTFALLAAVLFGVSTPFAKLLLGEGCSRPAGRSAVALTQWMRWSDLMWGGCLSGKRAHLARDLACCSYPVVTTKPHVDTKR